MIIEWYQSFFNKLLATAVVAPETTLLNACLPLATKVYIKVFPPNI